MRNTPDPHCGVSPSVIVFDRPLRDYFLFTECLKRESYSKRWKEACSAKEEALRFRFIRNSESINLHAKHLHPLSVGDKCFVQNQTGAHAKKWHHTGTVTEVLPHNKYAVRIDGSGRVTMRNRRFLKKYTPVTLTVNNPGLRHPIIPFRPEGTAQNASDTDVNSKFDQANSKLPVALYSPRNDFTQPDVGGCTPYDCEPCDNTESQLTTSQVSQRAPPNVSNVPQSEVSYPLITPGSEANEGTIPGRSTPVGRIGEVPAPTSSTTKPPTARKVPLALRRLADYNAPGKRW